MKTYTTKLHETSTYKVRHATLTRWEGDAPFLAVLEVVEQRSEGTKEYTRRYAVGELESNDEGRRFQFSKPKLVRTPEDDEFYVVLLTATGSSCTCRAGLDGKWCVHRESMEKLSKVAGAMDQQATGAVS